MAGTRLLAFNRGVLSKLGLCRVADIERLAFAAEDQTNWLPRVLGSMMLRPGRKYVGATHDDGLAKAMMIPFVFADDDAALVEISDGDLRVWIDDVILTRGSVSTAVSNGSFTSNLTGWTDADESGAASTHDAGGYMALLGDGTNAAIRRQTLTIGAADQGDEHGIRIVIERGPVTFKIGSTSGGEELFEETELGTGEHSLAFTPPGASAYLEFSSKRKHTVLVDSCTIESSGPVVLDYSAGEDYLGLIRHTQSANVIYAAGDGPSVQDTPPVKIERRTTRSWSVVNYEPETGPFRIINLSQTTLTPSALSGDITLAASKPVFSPNHVGALFRIASIGQSVAASISGADSFSDPIRVSGIDNQRIFSVSVSGTFTATVTLQYSVDEPGSWVDVDDYTTTTSIDHDDTFDNQIIYYRIGIKAGNYTSGTADVQLSYASGSISGVCRVTDYASDQSVSAVVLKDFGGTSPSKDWWEGEWSNERGWPDSVALYEGRLWWAGRDKVWGSISDAYEDFDDEFEGDAGPIARGIGFGPIQNIHWLLPLQKLLIGTALNSAPVAPGLIDGNNPIVARSTGFDEPLTPTNFNLKTLAPTGLFVDRSKQRLYALEFDGTEYVPADLNKLAPDINIIGITYIAVQMKPDVRVHCVLSDGTASVLVFDRVENVLAWIPITAEGEIEHAVVLPGDEEDQVYYTVKYTIEAATKRYLEKWALESNCTGRPVAHLADAHVIYSGAATTTITGLDHLESETVVCWGWDTTAAFEGYNNGEFDFSTDGGDRLGRDFGEFLVENGEITLPVAVTDACVGLGYQADFKGVKFRELNIRGKINEFALSLLNTHYQGVTWSTDGNTYYDLPSREKIRPTQAYHVWDQVDMDMTTAGGNWDQDARLWLRAAAPRPATVRAATIDVQR